MRIFAKFQFIIATLLVNKNLRTATGDMHHALPGYDPEL